MNILTLASISKVEGVGKAIVEEAIRLAAIEGRSEVTVVPGPGAAGFYRKLGFVHDPASWDPVGMVYYVGGQEHPPVRGQVPHGSLSKAEIWNLADTGMPYYNDLMKDPDYFKREKGVEGKIIYVSPAEYMRMAAEVHGVAPDKEYLMVEDHLVKEYAERMREGHKFPLPVVDFASKTQEGRNRVMAAASLGEKEVPVLVVRQTREESERQPGRSIRTLTLPPATKAAMLALCKRAQGKKVEYGMTLHIQDHELVPGLIKWGARRVIRFEAELLADGLFHTHPDKLRPHFDWEELHGRKSLKSAVWETVETVPALSDVDMLQLLIDDKIVFVGVGTPHRRYIKAMTQVKEVEPELKNRLMDIAELVVSLGTPVEGLEGYYREYTIRLDDGAPSYIDVWI